MARTNPILTIPAPPTFITGTPGNGQIALRWIAPSVNPSKPVTGYIIRYSANGVPVNSITINAITTYVLTGLINGLAYTINIFSRNTIGNSPASNPIVRTPISGISLAPTAFTGVARDKQVVLKWTAVSSTATKPVTGYLITYSGAGGSTVSVPLGNVTTLTVTGLTNGIAYTFNVYATNIGGSGPASTPLILTPSGPPILAPTGLSATPATGQITLRWTAVTSTTAAPISGYTVTYKATGVATATSLALSNVTTFTLAGLTNGLAYTFNVNARNTIGSGPASTTLTATPILGPSPPSGLSGTAGNAQVTLNWTVMASTPARPVNGYSVTYTAAGVPLTTVNVTGNVATTTVTGLTNGVTYTFTIYAINPVRSSTASNSVVLRPVLLPSVPTGFAGTAVNGQVVLTWVAPVGPAILTGYTVTYSATGVPLTSVNLAGNVLTTTVTGLTNGLAYTFNVNAINIFGSGPISTSLILTPILLPSAPTGFAGTAINGQAVLTWVAPIGPATVTGYTVTYRATGVPLTSVNVVGNVLTATVTGLTNGLAYTFNVNARNTLGSSPASTSLILTPILLPSAPTGLAGTAVNGQAVLTWVAPVGPATITGYTVTYIATGVPLTSVNVTGNVLTTTVTGLTNGLAYTFNVNARNIGGSSPASTPLILTPILLPSAPTGLAGTVNDGQAILTWVAPIGPATVTGYTVTYSAAGGSTVSVSIGNVLTATVTGLTNEIAYTFNVYARNTLGSSPASTSLTLTPTPLPIAPVIRRILSSGIQYFLQWYSSSYATGYRIVYSYPGQSPITINTTDLSYTFYLSPAIVYTFYVYGTNAAGVSPASEPYEFTYVYNPKAPTEFTGTTDSSGNITLTWVPSVVSPEYPALYYIITYEGVENEQKTPQINITSSTYTFFGLPVGVVYTFNIYAYNIDPFYTHIDLITYATNSVVLSTFPFNTPPIGWLETLYHHPRIGKNTRTVIGGEEILYTQIDANGIYARFDSPNGVTSDASDNLYIADTTNRVIRKVDIFGNVSTLAGYRSFAFNYGKYRDGQGTNALFNSPFGIAVDSYGNLYITDLTNINIRKIDISGNVTTFAGDGVIGSADGQGTNARFRKPSGITIDISGNLYITDEGNHRIRKIDQDQNVTTIAGNGVAGSSDGQGTNTSFNNPSGITIDSTGMLYIADTSNNTIRTIDVSGNVRTFAGNPLETSEISEFINAQGTNATFNSPRGIIYSSGSIYLTHTSQVDTGRYNSQVRKIDLSGNVTSIAGYLGATNKFGTFIRNSFNGYFDGIGTNGWFGTINGITMISNGTLYLTDATYNTIRKIDLSGNVTTFAGGCSNVQSRESYDGTPRLPYPFFTLSGITKTPNGTLYVASNLSIYKYENQQMIYFKPDIGGNSPKILGDNLTSDISGNLYVTLAEFTDNTSIQKVDPSGNVTFLGTNTSFNNPRGIVWDSDTLYIADTYNHVIRTIDAFGNTSIFAGSSQGFVDAQGTNAKFNYPDGLTFDSGNLYVADVINNRIRKIDMSGNVTTFAGDGVIGSTNGQGTNARFRLPSGITSNTSGTFYISDSLNHLIRVIDPSGNVTTLLGGGPTGSAHGSIDGIGSYAMLNIPNALYLDGNMLYICDGYNRTIRQVRVA